MRDKLVKFVYNFRIAIYILGILAFFVSVFFGCSDKMFSSEFTSPTVEDGGESHPDNGDFWPPDFVPHPHNPNEPKDPEGPTPCHREQHANY